MRRLGPIALTLVLAGSAQAAETSAEIKRALAAVGPSASEAPAVREEARQREPSQGFLVGAALGAWINAAAQLDFDLKNPEAAGPPHAHLAQDGDSFLRDDCRDETTAFANLQSRSQALGLTPEGVAAVAGVSAAAWRERVKGPVAACR